MKNRKEVNEVKELGADRLLEIADGIYDKYKEELDKNGGRDGTTAGFGYKMQLLLMKDLLAEIGVVYEFKGGKI